MDKPQLRAGAAAADITPRNKAFLYGYPHVERYSEGTHDPLMSSALYLEMGDKRLLVIANDLVNLDRRLTRAIREGISKRTGLDTGAIMVTATHTHSGPIIMRTILNEGDALIPEPDSEYLKFLVDTAVENACRAIGQAQPAILAHTIADASRIGGNRRDPAETSDPEVPVLAVKNTAGEWLAVMLVCCVHPTVLHEDTRLFSADFPGMTRNRLQQQLTGANCPILHLTGPSGNQSPRHFVRGNTFTEAERLGGILADSIVSALKSLATNDYLTEPQLAFCNKTLELPLRQFPAVEAARAKLAMAESRLQSMRETGESPATQRTAEVDVFGARRELRYAYAQSDGRMEQAHRLQMPAEIQVFHIGSRTFAAWPGEFFVEYGLSLKKQCPDTFAVTLANGVLNGYVVTPEAAAEGGYEASSGLLSPHSGSMMVAATVKLLR